MCGVIERWLRLLSRITASVLIVFLPAPQAAAQTGGPNVNSPFGIYAEMVGRAFASGGSELRVVYWERADRVLVEEIRNRDTYVINRHILNDNGIVGRATVVNGQAYQNTLRVSHPYTQVVGNGNVLVDYRRLSSSQIEIRDYDGTYNSFTVTEVSIGQAAAILEQVRSSATRRFSAEEAARMLAAIRPVASVN